MALCASWIAWGFSSMAQNFFKVDSFALPGLIASGITTLQERVGDASQGQAPPRLPMKMSVFFYLTKWRVCLSLVT